MKKTDGTSNSRYGLRNLVAELSVVVHAALNVQHVKSHLCFMYGITISAGECTESCTENISLQKVVKGND